MLGCKARSHGDRSRDPGFPGWPENLPGAPERGGFHTAARMITRRILPANSAMLENRAAVISFLSRSPAISHFVVDHKTYRRCAGLSKPVSRSAHQAATR